MATTRRSVLVAALGGTAPQDPALLERFGGEEGIKKAIFASITHAKEAGFELEQVPEPRDNDIHKARLPHTEGAVPVWRLRGCRLEMQKLPRHDVFWDRTSFPECENNITI